MESREIGDCFPLILIFPIVTGALNIKSWPDQQLMLFRLSHFSLFPLLTYKNGKKWHLSAYTFLVVESKELGLWFHVVLYRIQKMFAEGLLLALCI